MLFAFTLSSRTQPRFVRMGVRDLLLLLFTGYEPRANDLARHSSPHLLADH
jgi:hypothetical protein